jgi:S-adenosylmethionine hydrolase
MALRYDTVSFLSDYGTVDEFVGVVHSVIRSITPDVEIVDITHQVPAYDVRAGGLTLARSAQYLCPGVVLAVVDPGVGTPRRAVAVEVGDGASVLVGPDNGLLAPAVALCGGATRAVELDNPDYQLPAPGPTFAGRDVFAPAAAHLADGTPLTDLGTEINVATLLPGVLPVTYEEDGALVGEVLWVDHYGNAQLNVDPDEIDGFGDRLRLRFGDDTRTARRVDAFGDVGPNEIGLVVDSYGLLAIVVDRHSASGELGLHPSTEVRLEPFDDDGSVGITSRVQLRRKEVS